jgi:type VI secretion system secreted protein Hcp
MATDMFLKLSNSIKGESKDDKHKDEIEILAWSWGVSNSGSAHSGTGAGTGKASIQDITFTKYVDKSTPSLVGFACNGQHIKEAKLTVRKAAGKEQLEYLTIELKHALVTSVSTGAGGGEERLTESLTLNFAAFELSYTPQKPDGTADKTIDTHWDIPANKAQFT